MAALLAERRPFTKPLRKRGGFRTGHSSSDKNETGRAAGAARGVLQEKKTKANRELLVNENKQVRSGTVFDEVGVDGSTKISEAIHSRLLLTVNMQPMFSSIA